MTNRGGYGAALRQVNRIFEGGTVAGLTEGQLLERFVTRRDEIAFEALVARHGPMVFGVCRRILRDPSDAEDAFQATFLVLVRQARSIRGRDTLGGWLHRVAYRVAIRASTNRRKSEDVALDSLAAPEAADRDLIALIHEELDRLPAKYRAPIILCDLENHTHEQAAQALRWPLGTVKGRLSRARTLLKDRLTRRGVGAPAVAVGLVLGRDAKAIVSPILLDSTVKAAMSLAAGTGLVAGAASAVAVGLAQGVTRTMFWQSIKLTTSALVALSLVGVAGVGGVGTFGQVPGGEGKAAAVVGASRKADPSPPELPAPAVFGEQAAENPPKSDPDDDLRPTARALLGTWKVIEKQDGDIDEIGLPFKDKVVITRDRIQLGEPGEADLKYALGLLTSPKLIMLIPTFNTPRTININNDKSSSGVFQLNGNRLTIAYMGLDHAGESPASVDNNQPGGQIFVVKLEREGTAPGTPEKLPAVPSANLLTKLQGGWVLSEQTYRYAGSEYKIDKINKIAGPPGMDGMYGRIGRGFFFDYRGIHDNQSANDEQPVVGLISQFNPETNPKHIDIIPTDHVVLVRRGIPIGKAIYTLDGDRFTICYDPFHPDTRPEQFPRDGDDLTGDTRVVSVFEHVTPPPAAKTHPNGDIRGRWKRISFVENGTPEPLPPGLHDDIFTDTMHGQLDDNGLQCKDEYRIDTQAKPWRIKVTDLASGELQFGGIYKIDGDRLTICFARPGATLPSDYESKPGSQHQLLTLEWVGPITEELNDQMQRARETRLEKTRSNVEHAVSPPAVKPAVQSDLQGRWKVVSTVTNGESYPSNSDVIFTNSMMGAIGAGNHINYIADYRADSTATPNRLDLSRPQDPSANTEYGIYKVDGDDLVICSSGPKDLDRPGEFISKEGSGRSLTTLKRIGDVTPDMALKLQQSRAQTHPRSEKPAPPAASAPENPPPPAAKATVKHDLRGRWKLLSVIHDGVERKQIPASLPDTIYSGSITGFFADNGIVGYGSEYTVNVKTNPMQIDRSTPQVGIAPPSVSLGIYRIDGDRLTTCYGAKGGGRPTEFESTAGSSRNLMVYRWVGPLTESLELQLLQARAQRLALLSDPAKANAPAPPPPAPPGPGIPLPPRRPEPTSKSDLRGRWKMVSIVQNGQPIPVLDKEKENEAVYTKSLLGSVGKDRVEYRSDYGIEPDSNRITFLRPQAGGRFKPHHGLFRLEGDDLTLCLPDPEQDQLPTDFASTPGSNISLVTYKRVGPLTEELIAQIYRARAERFQLPEGPARATVVPPAPPALPDPPVPPTPPVPSAPVETHAKGDLRGQWKLVSRVDGGQVDEVSPKWTAVYSDDWYGEINEKGLNYKSLYRVETDVTPWQLKYVRESDGAVNLVGIYKIEGDRLTVCLAPGTPSEVMTIPSEFEAKAGSRHRLLTFQRVGPITEDMTKQLKQSHDVRQKEADEQRRKWSETMANLRYRMRPPREGEKAELEMVQEVLSTEWMSLQGGMNRAAQEIKSLETKIRDGEAAMSRLPERDREQWELDIAGMRERIAEQKKSYVQKFRELSRVKKEMSALNDDDASKFLYLPLTDPSPATNPAGRLAEFDHQIRLLQQKRDAFLMNLPDEERRKLSKELAP